MSEPQTLPTGWVQTTLGNVVSSFKNGISRRPVKGETGAIVLRLIDITSNRIDISNPRRMDLSDEELESYNLNYGDILFIRVNGSSENIGKGIFVNRYEEDIKFNDHLIRGVFISPVLSLYLSYYCQLSNIRRYLIKNASSSAGQITINQNTLSALQILLPPLAEQQRIVAAIEQQFTRLDAGIASLRQAQTRLKRYRAAVLKAAVEGHLTAAWRAEHPNTEPAETLLARILTERRTCWEDEQRAKGKDPAKLTYAEPARPDTSTLPALPEGWTWATVEQLGDVGTGATPLRSNPAYYVNGTVPWITSGAIHDNLILQAEERITELAVANTNAKVFPSGSLIIAMYGEGKTRGMVSQLGIHATTNQACAVIVQIDLSLKSRNYLKIFLLSHYFEIRKLASGGVQPNLNLSIIKQLCFPLPPLAEQEQIVAEVERRLSVVSEVEAEVLANLKRAERLRQSILREAFAGRLVAQDPADESASVLLERIRAERSARDNNGSRNRRKADIAAQPTTARPDSDAQVERMPQDVRQMTLLAE